MMLNVKALGKAFELDGLSILERSVRMGRSEVRYQSDLLNFLSQLLKERGAQFYISLE